ncbi:aspartyl-phosphate phosphatase Spo0E family protein [Halonatronum saccharophilum]|uniref:aspartyl-phosphate phosphatase Spo0E family protein n=1 Tax=Halonatronum saccharophilum TaxID=150060 RepID=UPI0004BA7CE3|nr:aspartyl-phosphate phosphatase Spo0E family protein [Halonatronum saccharophilum]
MRNNNCIRKEIELLRTKMVEEVRNNASVSEDAIKISQELDEKILSYMINNLD